MSIRMRRLEGEGDPDAPVELTGRRLTPEESYQMLRYGRILNPYREQAKAQMLERMERARENIVFQSQLKTAPRDVVPYEAPRGGVAELRPIPEEGSREDIYIPVPEPEPERKSFTEQILEFVGGIAEQEQREVYSQTQETGYFDVMKWQRAIGMREAGGALAGMVAAPEAFVYTIGGVAGFQTPRPPPTVLGSMVTTAISPFTSEGFSTESFENLAKYGVGYGFGTVLGDVLFGKALVKTYQGVKHVTPSFIKAPVGRVASRVSHRVGQTFRPVSQAYRSAKYRATGWLGERWGWYKARHLRLLKHKQHLFTSPPDEAFPLIQTQVADPTEPLSWIRTPEEAHSIGLLKVFDTSTPKLSPSAVQAQSFFWDEPTYGMAEIWATSRPSSQALSSAASKWVASTLIASGKVHTPFSRTLERAQMQKTGGLMAPLSPPEEQLTQIWKTTGYRQLPRLPSFIEPHTHSVLEHLPLAMPEVHDTPHERLGEYVQGYTWEPKLSWKQPTQQRNIVEPTVTRLVKEKPDMMVTPFETSKTERDLRRLVMNLTGSAMVDRQREAMIVKPLVASRKQIASQSVQSLWVPEAFTPQITATAPPSYVGEPLRKKRKKKRKKKKGFAWKYRVHPVAEPEQLLPKLAKEMWG